MDLHPQDAAPNAAESIAVTATPVPEAPSRGVIVRDGQGRLARRPDGPSAQEFGRLRRQLHPLPRGLVELYGLLAVLFVLVPEWMAGGALQGIQETQGGDPLPAPTRAWQRVPELRLASMNLAELRLLARNLGLGGYGGLNRERLTARLLRRLNRSKPWGTGPEAL